MLSNTARPHLASGPSLSVPLGYDVIAAGIAVAVFGTFLRHAMADAPDSHPDRDARTHLPVGSNLGGGR
jgi:hypothetical protein